MGEIRIKRPSRPFDFWVVLAHSVAWLILILAVLALVWFGSQHARDGVASLRTQLGDIQRQLADKARNAR